MNSLIAQDVRLWKLVCTQCSVKNCSCIGYRQHFGKIGESRLGHCFRMRSVFLVSFYCRTINWFVVHLYILYIDISVKLDMDIDIDIDVKNRCSNNVVKISNTALTGPPTAGASSCTACSPGSYLGSTGAFTLNTQSHHLSLSLSLPIYLSLSLPIYFTLFFSHAPLSDRQAMNRSKGHGRRENHNRHLSKPNFEDRKDLS